MVVGTESGKGKRKKEQIPKGLEAAPRRTAFIFGPAIDILLITALGFLVYSNTFHVPLLFDDESNIRQNITLQDAAHLTEAPVSLLLVSPRIIGSLTFAMNHALHGFNVEGYHVVNLLIHLTSALLVYRLVMLLFRTPCREEAAQGAGNQRYSPGERLVALCTALLFVSHPIQTQAVTYIIQRYASLATLFYLSSIVLYIEFRLSRTSPVRWGLYGGCLLSAVLAMKTKEIAFTLPVMVALCEVLFFRGAIKKRLAYLAPLLLTMAIIPLSLAGLKGDSLADGVSINELTKVAGAVDTSRGEYLMTQFRVIVTYLRLLLFPVNQNLDYDYTIYRSFFALPVLSSFLLLLSILGGSMYLLYRSFRSNRDRQYWFRLISFGVLWFFITISVESSIIPIRDVIFEHRVYLPSIGFFMAFMAGVMWLGHRRGDDPLVIKTVSVFMVLVIALLSATAYARNSVWQNEVTLWEDAVKKSPEKTRPNYNLGLFYSREGRIDEAITLYRRAIRTTPHYYRPYNDLGNAYFNKGHMDDALKEYQTAVMLKPDYAEAHNNIGIVYVNKGRYEEAVSQFQRAIALKPDYADAHANLGNVYYERGAVNEAVKHYRIAMKLQPDHPIARSNLESLRGR